MTDEFRFNVPTPIGQLHELARAKPEFPQYLKIRMIQDELDRRAGAYTSNLPSVSRTKQPLTINDGTLVWDGKDARAARTRMETDNPEFVKAYTAYQENLAETRRFVTDHQTNAIQDTYALMKHSSELPSFPLFEVQNAAEASSMLKRVIAGENPLYTAENAMRKVIQKQMKYDADKTYIDMAHAKAFTPRTPEWVRDEGAEAASHGAILRRTVKGETRYWTADPLLVSLMNTGHIPLGSLEYAFTRSKGLFQTATTGWAAPWFAPTGGIRAMEQGWTTAPGGVRSAEGWRVMPAGPYSSLAAIPAQLAPQLANYLVSY